MNMKTKPKIIFLVISSFFLVTNFKKQTVDFRDQYLGVYFCNRNCQVLKGDKTGLEMSKDTVTIVVTKDPADSVLNIKADLSNFKIKLLNGKLYSNTKGSYCTGQFVGDSIKLGTSIGRVSNMCTYSGKKK